LRWAQRILIVLVYLTWAWLLVDAVVGHRWLMAGVWLLVMAAYAVADLRYGRRASKSRLETPGKTS
jgi:type VI protein secretion system component VasK